MQAQGKSRLVHMRWAILTLCLMIAASCTVLCSHIDKPGGDDGRGHCSICLNAAVRIIQPAPVLQVAPVLLVSAVVPKFDPIVRQEHFDSSLYIRPPPLS